MPAYRFDRLILEVISIAWVVLSPGVSPADSLNWEYHEQGSRVMCMAADTGGIIWFGTEGNGLWRFDPSGGAGPEQWTHFTHRDGLGDDDIYAASVDLQGRVWVGHLDHGVSVFAGGKWTNYDSMAGPLGARVFAMSVCPVDGSVWIATEMGISRYSPASDSWTNLTVADGLPANEASCIAFDKAGNVFIGMQCEGIAMASASDDYKNWRIARGPDKLPNAPKGSGLSSSLINSIVVLRSGSIVVGTNAGICRSDDGGKTWSFVRGADSADKTRGLLDPPPAAQVAAPGTLREDYVSALAEDESGNLWIGYRSKGYECRDAATMAVKFASGLAGDGGAPGGQVTGILAGNSGKPVIIATYGKGVYEMDVARIAGASQPTRDASATATGQPHRPPATMPGRAKPITARQMDRMSAAVRAAATQPIRGAFLGDDWNTGGDWYGRYGRQLYDTGIGSFVTSGYSSLRASVKINNASITVPLQVFPSSDRSELFANDPRAPIVPQTGLRSDFQQDGPVASKPLTQEGPDVCYGVTVPAGTHRLSLYFSGLRDEADSGELFDYVLELYGPANPPVSRAGTRGARGVAPPSPGIPTMPINMPLLALARVCQISGGVYKQFVVAGPAQFWLRINRNYCSSALTVGLFADALPMTNTMQVQRPDMIGYKPPAMAADSDIGAVSAAMDFCSTLDGRWDSRAALFERPFRFIAYKLAADTGGGADVLDNWRWGLGLWTPRDKTDFNQAMDDNANTLAKINNAANAQQFSTLLDQTWKSIQAGLTPRPTRSRPGTKPTMAILLRNLAIDLQTKSNVAINPTDAILSGDLSAADEMYRTAMSSGPAALYAAIGKNLSAADDAGRRQNVQTRRDGLGTAAAAARTALDRLHDPALAAMICDVLLLPNWQIAPEAAPESPRKLSRQILLQTMADAYAASGDQANRAKVLALLINLSNPADAESLRIEMADALIKEGNSTQADLQPILQRIGPGYFRELTVLRSEVLHLPTVAVIKPPATQPARGRGMPAAATQPSFAELLKAAQQGDVHAMTLVGGAYRVGNGVAQSDETSLEWFRKAADKGDGDAMSDIGLAYVNGRGVARDLAQGLEWYRKGAEAGSTLAMINLATRYRAGSDVTRDYQAAMSLYMKAADKGNEMAMYSIGMMYEQGQGMTADLKTAADWMTRAAAAGSAPARNWLMSHNLQ